MKMKNFIYIICSLVLISCEPEMDNFELSEGNADFSTMVAVGNSLTAGFADGELYRSAQLNSFPNIVAQQMMHVGGGEFKQPLMKNDYGFGNRLVLGIINGNLAPLPYGNDESAVNFPSIFDEEGPFNNFGVPGAKTDHLLANGYGVLNEYFGRFAKNINTSSILGDALMTDPTFFLLWIGNNDILSFAMSGGVGETITNIDYYRTIINTIVDELTAKNAKGAIANIPDVTSAPFFTTIPPKGLILNAQQAANLNLFYANRPHIQFSEGPNGFVVHAAMHIVDSIRQLTQDDLLLLSVPQDSLNAGWGSTKPIPPNYFLSKQQIDEINTAVYQYNEYLEGIASIYELAYVNINSLLKKAVRGIYFDGVSFNTQYVSGGVFSLDGIHLTARGNVIMANEFIDAINNKYNSSIPKVSVTDYEGIIFP